MNNPQNYVVYSYTLGDQIYQIKPANVQQDATATRMTVVGPENIVQVIPASAGTIIQAQPPIIRFVENIQYQEHIQPAEADREKVVPISAGEIFIDGPQHVLTNCVTDGTQPEPSTFSVSEVESNKAPEEAIECATQKPDITPADEKGKKRKRSATSSPLKPIVSKTKKDFIYECDICDSRFLTVTSLKLHKTGHRYVPVEEKKAFCCRYCGRQFSHMQTLGDHEKVHIDDRYNCGACGARYNSKSGLRNHLAKNVECDANFQHAKQQRKKQEEQSKQHECEICGKKYRHRKSMVEHRSLHFRNEQHKCERCGAMFETSGGWRKHTSNGRCEFSKSKFKDPGGSDEIFIPEERRKFLEQMQEAKNKRKDEIIKKRKSSLRRYEDLEESCSTDNESVSCGIEQNESAGEQETSRQPTIELVTVPEIPTETTRESKGEVQDEHEIPIDSINIDLEVKEEIPSDGDDSNKLKQVSDDKDQNDSQLSKKESCSQQDMIKSHEIDQQLEHESAKVVRGEEDPKLPPASNQKRSKKHECSTCHKTFARKFVLKTHLRTHTGERPFLCDSCPKSFGDAASLKMHIVIHTGEKAFHCSECPARFARKSGLRNHITVHFNLPCDECDQKFPSRKTLMRHKLKHQGIRPFLCEICSKDFRTKADLKAHMRIHSNEKRYSCKICSARFNCPSTLRRHRNVHAPPETRPVCETCGNSFSSQQALRKHENIHKDLKPYPCDICSKRFRVKDHLKIHQRSHSGEKPFSCDVCEKRFVTNGDLKVHYRRHTGEKPFSCDECGQSFVVTAGLYRHQQKTGHRSDKPQAIIVAEYTRAT